MMNQNSQFLNPHANYYSKRSPDRTDTILSVTNKPCDKLHSFQTSTGDISQDLIKELTLKNNLLNAQLVQYRKLVSNLNQRLHDLQEQNQQLRNRVEVRLQSTRKLHTIEEEHNSLSQITTKSRRREGEEVKQQYYFHQISQMLNSYNLHRDNMSWQGFISVIESALQQRKSMIHFISNIRQMRKTIDPGADSLLDLWQWLKKLGWNYHCLLQYRYSRDEKYINK